MPILFVPDRDALRLVLGSAVLPTTLTARPVRGGIDAANHLWLQVETPLGRAQLSVLQRFGIQSLGSAAVAIQHQFPCWHALLPLRPQATEHAPISVIILEVPCANLPQVVRDLQRFGQADVSLGWPELDGETAFVRVEQPPMVVVERLSEPPTNLRCYIPQSPSIWIRRGYSYPIVEQIPVRAGQCIRLDPPGEWTEQPLPTFRSLNLNMRTLPAVLPRRHDRFPRMQVDQLLRFQPTMAPAEPTFWILPGPGKPALRRLVQTLDERFVPRLRYALVQQGRTTRLLLHWHGGKDRPPVVILPGAAFAAVDKLANLFLPVQQQLHPRLRRDVLRVLLAPDPQLLVWLEVKEPGRFLRSTVPLKAFRPLVEIVRFSVPPRREHYSRMPAFGPFGLLPYVARPEPSHAEPTPGSTSVRDGSPEVPGPTRDRRSLAASVWLRLGALLAWRPRWKRKVPTEPAPVSEAPMIPVVALSPPKASSREIYQQPAEWQARKRELEEQILASLGRLTAEQRVEIWPELAGLYARTQNYSDAALCWLNALWEEPTPSSMWAWGWLRAEARSLRGTHLESELVRLAEQSQPIPLDIWLGAAATPGHVRSLAAYLVWSSRESCDIPGLTDQLGTLQAYLDRHEEWLPHRAAWLVRLSLARLTRGDVLGLARTRDRLTRRMHELGLSLELDLPSFLRFDRKGSSERFQQVRDWIGRIRELMRRWLREISNGGRLAQFANAPVREDTDTQSMTRLKGFGLTGEATFTPAYADLILAWTLARLGEHQTSNDWLERATRILDNGDPVHAFLSRAFQERIQQVREGKPGRGPLSAELRRFHDSLPDTAVYLIDLFLSVSRILEPSLRRNPYRAAILRHCTSCSERERMLYTLPDLEDPRLLNERARHLLESIPRQPTTNLPDDRVLRPILEALLPLGSLLEDDLQERILQHTTELLEPLAAADPLAVLPLVEHGLFLAATVIRPTSFRHLIEGLLAFLEHRLDVPMSGLDGVVAEGLRGLRRLGLTAEMEALLSRFEAWLSHAAKNGGGVTAAEEQRVRLRLAGGWLFLGRDSRAMVVLDQARDALLYTRAGSLEEQSDLALAYASTLGAAGLRVALGRLEELFQRYYDILITKRINSHFMLRPLQLIETMMWGIVDEEFTLDPRIRSWLDAEEFLIRQRIDRDLRGFLAEQGSEAQC